MAPHVANSGLTTGAGYYYSTDIWSKLQLLKWIKLLAGGTGSLSPLHLVEFEAS